MKKLWNVLLITLIVFPGVVYAEDTIYCIDLSFPTYSESPDYIHADSSGQNNIFLEVKVAGETTNGSVKFYDKWSYLVIEEYDVNLANGPQTFYVQSTEAYRMKLFSYDGKLIDIDYTRTKDVDTGETYITATSITTTYADYCNGDTGGGDPGSGDPGSGGTCEACEIFNAPEWDEYMLKINQILDKIPSPPDWDMVADTFYDRIVPRLVDDLEDMLGAAPDPPAPPSLPAEPEIPSPLEPPTANVSDRGIETKEPEMQDIPELDLASFDRSDIENNAPEIEVRSDPTGGFDIADPAESLPDFPTDQLPIPGQTDPGEWGQYKPEPIENPFPAEPAPSADDGSTIPDSGPVPDMDTGSAPLPGQDLGEVPMPDGGTFEGSLFYKESPDG